MANVAYRSGGLFRDMASRAMTTTGTRAQGRLPTLTLAQRPILRAVQPGLSGLGCDSDGSVSYGTAKRLGALGAGAVLTEGVTGVKTGVTAAGITTTLGTGIASAIGAGAAAGSVVPIIGTAIGAIVGLVASGVFSHRVDPEVGNFNNALALSHAQGPQAVFGIQDKYLVLAGLFDLQPHQIKGNLPMYRKYGRMGEHAFVTDMMNRIQQAANQGVITGSDTVQSVYQKVVVPWMNTWGYGALQDPNGDMIVNILIGLIGEYVSGQWKTRWYARGGDFAFNNLQPFSLPAPPAAPRTLPAPAVQTPLRNTNPCPAPYLWNGSQCVLPTPAQPPQSAGACVAPYVWNGTQCVIPAGANPTVPTSTAQPVGGRSTAPPGFTAVGNDVNGNPIFANGQGVLYQWTGTQMQLFSGQLASAASPAAQMQAALQNALAAGQAPQQAAAAALNQAQASGVAVTPQLQQQVAAQTDATAQAPVAQTAGLSLGGNGLLAIAAGIGLLMFATAHPATAVRNKGGRRHA